MNLAWERRAPSRPVSKSSPQRAEAVLGVPITRFMVSMRDFRIVEATHEPDMLRVTDSRSGPRLCDAQQFMVVMREFRIIELSMYRASCLLAPGRLEACSTITFMFSGTVHGPIVELSKSAGAIHKPET